MQPDPTALIAAVREAAARGEPISDELLAQLLDAARRAPPPISPADQRRRDGVGAYRTVSRPGHPLAAADGSVAEHRLVLYNKIGPGPHPCHWCGDLVDWTPSGTTGRLCSDHLNGIHDDNRPENLVPSCNRCNHGRGGAEVTWSKQGRKAARRVRFYRRDRKPYS